MRILLWVTASSISPIGVVEPGRFALPPKDLQAPYTVRWTMYIRPYTSAPENVPCYLTALYRVLSPSATTSQGFYPRRKRIDYSCFPLGWFATFTTVVFRITYACRCSVCRESSRFRPATGCSEHTAHCGESYP